MSENDHYINPKPEGENKILIRLAETLAQISNFKNKYPVEPETPCLRMCYMVDDYEKFFSDEKT